MSNLRRNVNETLDLYEKLKEAVFMEMRAVEKEEETKGFEAVRDKRLCLLTIIVSAGLEGEYEDWKKEKDMLFSEKERL